MEELKVALEKASKSSELFEKKNAELELVNDKLRMENTELLRTIDQLSEEVRTLKSERPAQQNRSSESENVKITAKSNQLKADSNFEVHTLRKVKKELEEQLDASKSTTLSFQASFQAEFDLRNQIELRLDELRERYERLISENEQLRLILAAHNITAPSPPGLRSMPGSRKKKHGLKARPMTMYFDLSAYHSPPADPAVNKPVKPPRMARASSLKSLEEKPLKSPSESGDKSHDGNGLVSEKVEPECEKSSGMVVLAETAQTVESENDTELPGNDQSGDPTSTSEAAQEGGAVASVTTPPEPSYPADTLMWNAKGFLSRIENIDQSDGQKDPPERNERDVEELKEMMTSVSAKTLEGAKAFLEAKQRNNSTDNFNN